MTSKVLLSAVKSVVSKTYFHNEGDPYERGWWPFFKERFPNCEEFWRHMVVPLTGRVASPKVDGIRPGIWDDVEDMSLLHYCVFLNLVYAYDHLLNVSLSSFEDFYAHLVSACDLAEEFLLNIHLITLQCRNQKSTVLQQLSKDQFLQKADEWYDENYEDLYQHYISKGKGIPINLPAKKDVLGEYFKDSQALKGDSQALRKYRAFASRLRQYRNKMTHNVLPGRLSVGQAVLVPKKEKIGDYRKLSAVFAAQGNIVKLHTDFINMQEQMALDIGELERHLNELWRKPLKELKSLLYKERNPNLLQKYKITLDPQ